VSSDGATALRGRGEAVLEAMRARPGGEQLYELASARGDAALVGGATRDLLLGRTPRELDVVVAGDAAGFARELAARIADPGASVTLHGRFGTALVRWPGGRVDVAERRAESYPVAGALPEVRTGGAEQDLERRDFTVNAIAVSLDPRERGRLTAAPDALDDLVQRRLRVTHERSFIDDPTRLLRLARYRVRLGFEPVSQTAELAAQALAAGALETVSRARVGAELRLALTEIDAPATLAALEQIGVLAAIDTRLRFDGPLARRALALLPPDGRSEMLLLATLLLSLAAGGDGERAAFELLAGMEFTAPDRERALASALRAPALGLALGASARPSQVREAVGSAPLEAVALAGALGEDGGEGAATRARAWLSDWRHVRLQITGDDLLAAGVPAGPEIGRRLAAALARKLDGELDGDREGELRAALEADA
jgi:tRNA nucleotidyltransferase (CCA-adding enzyme)